MTSAKPASLPPAVTETRAVEELSGASCEERTELVVAPEQAVKAKEEGALALAHSCGYAAVLRLQEPLSAV
jgi:hypothetical protein